MFEPDATPPETEPQAVRRTVEAMAKRLVSDIITPVFWLALVRPAWDHHHCRA
jgi:hypothetical protein